MIFIKAISYKLDRSLKTPLYIQLFELLKNDILNGNISDGERLPSRRGLMASLGISKATAELAYRRLEEEGLSFSKPGSGHFAKINPIINAEIHEPDYYSNPGIEITMSQNGTDLSLIPRGELIKLYRDIAYDMPELFDYGHKFGEKTLRKAIAKSLNNLHGLGCSADRIIVGAGCEYLLEQLTHCFPRDCVFAFENANFARSYEPVKNSVSRLILLENALNGFSVGELYSQGVNVVYTSPDSQFPTNHRMTLQERTALLSWAAEAENRYIIEADFDLDFSDKGGLDTLFGMDKNDRVIFLGSFSRSIAPSVKTSYLVLPKKIKERFNKALPYYTCLSSRLEQQALARFIHSGRYSALCERLKRAYKEKREALINELKALPLWEYITLVNIQSGTYLIAVAENGMTEQQLSASAAKQGVKLMPLRASLRKASPLIPKNSFILGFGGLSLSEIKAAAQKLNRAWVKT